MTTNRTVPASAPAHPQPAADPIRSTLDAFVGGAMGDSFHVTWNGSTLTHQCRPRGTIMLGAIGVRADHSALITETLITETLIRCGALVGGRAFR